MLFGWLSGSTLVELSGITLKELTGVALYELALQPRNPLPVAFRAAVVPSLASPFVQRKECQFPRRLQVAIPVLVMNGQSLDGELPERDQRRVAAG